MEKEKVAQNENEQFDLHIVAKMFYKKTKETLPSLGYL